MTLGAYGKSRESGDFLQLGQPGQAAAAFRDWVHDAFESSAREKMANVTEGQVFSYVFRTPEHPTELLVGAIRPSHDAVGRRFALSVYAECAAAASLERPHLIPLILEGFFERARAGLAEGGNLADTLRGLPAPSLQAGLAAQQQRYDSWLRSSAVGRVWKDLFGDVARGVLGHVLAVIDGGVEPWRGQETPPTPLSVRLPLGAQGALGVAFWIDVVRSLAGWRATVPTVFWDAASGDAVLEQRPGCPSVLVHLGEAPARSLLELWVPDADSDSVCDLTAPPSSANLEPSEQLSGLLARTSEGGTCADFIQGLV